MFRGFDVVSYLEELLFDTTDGPWENLDDKHIATATSSIGMCEAVADTRFVVAVRNNIGSLLMEIKELREKVAKLDTVD